MKGKKLKILAFILWVLIVAGLSLIALSIIRGRVDKLKPVRNNTTAEWEDYGKEQSVERDVSSVQDGFSLTE
ncbi:MAG: hypothetical protein Q4D81_03640 [Eubacteriales bacterium]|nr:hypothetical protein [Eubacteriales bacterium]